MGGQKTIGKLCGEAYRLLKAKYWQCVAASVPLAIASFVMSTIVIIFLTISEMLIYPVTMMPMLLLPFAADGQDAGLFYGMMGITVAVMIAVVVIMLLYSLGVMILSLAVAIVEQTVGVSVMEAMLLLIKGDKLTFDALFGSFKKNWKRYLGVSAWSTLWTFLWSLLFCVPGVVKSCSYMLAPYLVVQYPDMTVRQALKKSMEITQGYKGRLFLIALIMTGTVYAVALLLCCVPMASMLACPFWIYPFYYAMLSIAFLDMKQAAIEKGLLPQDGVICK